MSGQGELMDGGPPERKPESPRISRARTWFERMRRAVELGEATAPLPDETQEQLDVGEAQLPPSDRKED
jgi:hypothetical protein